MNSRGYSIEIFWLVNNGLFSRNHPKCCLNCLADEMSKNVSTVHRENTFCHVAEMEDVITANSTTKQAIRRAVKTHKNGEHPHHNQGAR